ncbi:MAG: cytidylate kinase-like family protein, partial [Clostridiales bacterium]|nr:cytidylate kinase-like family protein [Clostridiales bacterium]
MAKTVITISREFGSGGRTIAKMAAERLGYAFYDKA